MSALDLEPLMTVCPHCNTRFRVTEAQLQAARGRVRCGTCLEVFDGVDQLVLDMPFEFATAQDALEALDELMAELLAEGRPPASAVAAAGQTVEIEAPRTAGATSGPDALEAAESGEERIEAGQNEAGQNEPGPIEASQHEPGATEPAPVESAEVEAVEVETVQAGSAEAEPAQAEPVEAGPEHAEPAQVQTATVESATMPQPVTFGPARRRRWPWLVVPLGLLAVAGQVLWFQFDTLVRDPAWRPLYAQLCTVVGCELPVQRALDRISTRNLTVRAAPDQPGTLQVRVVIVNEAEFPQPFPTLELRFSSLNGLLVAGHRFQPREYLAGDARNLQLMPPGTPVQLELAIPDPGEHAVNYVLDLR